MEPVDISSRIMETAPLNEANTSEPSRRIPPENEYKLMEFKKPIMIQPKDNCRVFEQYSSMTYIREEDDSRFGILWSNKNENESGYLVDLESRTIQTIKKGKVNSIKNDANESDLEKPNRMMSLFNHTFKENINKFETIAKETFFEKRDRKFSKAK